MKRRPRTLRARLSLGIAVLVLVVLAVVGIVVYYGTAQRLTASLDASLRTATAQALAGTNNQNGRLTLGPQLDEGVGSDELRAPGLSLAVFGPTGKVRRQFGPYDQSVAEAAALAAAQRGVTTTESRTDPLSDVRVRVRTTPLRENGSTLAVFSVALSEEPMLATLRQLRLTLLVLLPLAAAVAALLGYLLTRRMLRPLARMQATAAEISSHDLSQRLGVAAGGDEVSQLAATFDAMLDRLEESFVRERRFVADASHELRTPLAALQAIVSVTRERPRAAAEYEQALDDVDGETARLRTLVENLLELARGDAERLAEREPVDVSALLRDVCASLEVLADDKGLRLTCELEDDLMMQGDGDALVRLFVNVLDNAIKYTDVGGVNLAAGAADGHISVSVRDSGCGVPAEQVPHLFERFYRGDASRSAEGSGLGLAIARLVAEAHGGSIAITSREGDGTTCTIALPTRFPSRPEGFAHQNR
jgi:heavy metal sensor kinase